MLIRRLKDSFFLRKIHNFAKTLNLMKRISLIFFFFFIFLQCFADYSARGRSSDLPGHHDSPLEYVFMGIGGLILLAFIGIWIYYKVVDNKEKIADGCGTIFAGLFIFAIILGIGKCGESIHDNKKNNEKNNTQIQVEEKPHSNPLPSSNAPVAPSYKPQPQLKYRTVEYYTTCFYCNGSGRIICPKCKGSGSIKHTCNSCGGRGEYGHFKCIYCNGKGYTEDVYLNSGRHSCFTCGGTGYTTNVCMTCHGNGNQTDICDFDSYMYNKTHYITCEHCNGHGQIRQTRQESYYE